MKYPTPERVPRGRSIRTLLATAVLAAVALPATFVLGCALPSSQSGNGGTTAGSAGTTTRSSNGWFSVALGGASNASVPKTPRVESSSGRLADGTRLTSNSYFVEFGRSAFILVVNEFEGGLPGDPLDQANDMLDGFLDEIENFEVTSADAIVREGHPGTKVELRDPQQGRRMLIHSYAGRSRVYLFASLVANANDPSFATAENTFFTSIRLDAADAPSPDGNGALDFAAFAPISPPEAGIAVELPGRARRETRTIEVDGEDVRVFEYATLSSDRLSSMTARVYDFSDRPDDVLERLRELARNGDGTVSSMRPAQRQGYGGQAYLITSATQVRYVLDLIVGDRVVQLIHAVPLGQESAQADYRRRFLNSLRIF